MAKINLVIKINEEIYQDAVNSNYSHLYDEEVASAVADGVQLPKGWDILIHPEEHIFKEDNSLDAMRKEIESIINEEYIPCTGGYVSRTLSADAVLKIIDKYRKE